MWNHNEMHVIDSLVFRTKSAYCVLQVLVQFLSMFQWCSKCEGEWCACLLSWVQLQESPLVIFGGCTTSVKLTRGWKSRVPAKGRANLESSANSITMHGISVKILPYTASNLSSAGAHLKHRLMFLRTHTVCGMRVILHFMTS